MKKFTALLSTGSFVGLLIGVLMAFTWQPLTANNCSPSSSCYVDAGQNMWAGPGGGTADYCIADWDPNSGCDMGGHFCSGCTPDEGGEDLNVRSIRGSGGSTRGSGG